MLGIGGLGIGLGLGRTAGGTVAFAGAYDAIPNIVAAYGMRRLRAAYTGSILRLRRSSDNAEQDIGYDGSGHLDTAAVSTFIGASSGYIVNWYDQSGNAYTAAQATAGSQPLYVASGQNGRPVVRGDGVNDYLSFTMTTTVDFTTLWVWRAWGSGVWTNNEGVGGTYFPNAFYWHPDDSTKNVRLYITHTSGELLVGNQAPADITVLSSYTARHQQPNISEYWLNGANKITNTTAIVRTVVSRQMGLFTAIGSGRFTRIDLAEIIFCGTALSDANLQAAEAAANNYWAIY